MKTFWVSDLHIGHDKILAIRPFQAVEEMNQTLLKNWNETVGPQDLVFNLGDLYFHSSEVFTNINRQLNGTKILIRGNHDFKKRDWYLQRGFAEVLDEFFFISPTNPNLAYVVTHMPVKHSRILLLSNLYNKRIINIHGHSHGTSDPELRMDSLLFPDNYIEVCVESTGYKPIDLIV